MANGFPLSCIAGKRDVMKIFEEIFFSFTFGGETLALAACLATLRVFEQEPVIQHIWSQGEKLLKGYNALAAELGLQKQTRAHGAGCRHVLEFLDDAQQPHLEAKTLFQQEAIQGGVLYGPGHNLSYSHGDTEIQRTLETYGRALRIVQQAYESGDFKRFLKGKTVIPVFRKA